MFGFCSAASKGEDVKYMIDGLIIALFIITNYTSVCVLIASSPAVHLEKIMMWVFETILVVAALKCLEELE